MHPRTQGTWAIQGVEGDEMFKAIRPKIAHQRSHRTAFELEHADRVSPLEHLEHQIVVKGHVVDIGANACVVFDHVE